MSHRESCTEVKSLKCRSTGGRRYGLRSGLQVIFDGDFFIRYAAASWRAAPLRRARLWHRITSEDYHQQASPRGRHACCDFACLMIMAMASNAFDRVIILRNFTGRLFDADAPADEISHSEDFGQFAGQTYSASE